MASTANSAVIELVRKLQIQIDALPVQSAELKATARALNSLVDDKNSVEDPAAADRALLAHIFSRAGAVQLGTFTLKSGQISSIYTDLRVLVSTPELINRTADAICRRIVAAKLDAQFDYVVGVPLGAIPLAYSVALALGKSMLMKRKEAKSYGKKQLIEGCFERGRRAIVIEDVVTSGGSVLETVQVLRDEGLECDLAFCVLDRDQGGVAALREKGVTMNSLYQMSSILDFLVESGQIDATRRAQICHELQNPVYATAGEN